MIIQNFKNYEETGNYVFTISDCEIKKVRLGLNFEIVSFKRINHSNVKGIEFEIKKKDAPLFNKIKQEISKGDDQTKK